MSKTLILLVILSVLSNQKQVYSEFFPPLAEEAQDWITQNQITQDIRFSSCGEERIFGGLSIFGYKSLVSKHFLLPDAHYQVTVKVKFYRFDLWNGNKFYVIADGKVVHESSYDQVGYDVCGRGPIDQIVDLEFTFNHYNPSMILVFNSDLSFGDIQQSWGINKLEIHIDTCDSSCLFCIQAGECSGQNQKLVLKSLNEKIVEQNNNGFTGFSRYQKQYTSQCSGVSLFGGYGVFDSGVYITKELQQLQPHSKITVRFQFWDTYGSFNMEASLRSGIQQLWTYNPLSFGRQIQLCGDRYADKVTDVSVTFPHNALYLDLSFTSTGSWGIRDLQVFAHN